MRCFGAPKVGEMMSNAADQTGGRLTRRATLAFAAPMVVSNAVAPLAGMVDTAVIAGTGTVTDVAGIGLGVAVVNMVVFSGYVLRISTTALAAQAHGAGRVLDGYAILARAVILGCVVGTGLFALTVPVTNLALSVFAAEPGPTETARGYVHVRMVGAPAMAAAWAMFGWLVGRGRSGAVMGVVVAFTGTNIALDLVFVLGFDWGVVGAGLATTVAEWAAALMAGALCWWVIRGDRAPASAATLRANPSGSPSGGLASGLGSIMSTLSLWDRQAWMNFFGLSRDALLRTWCLVLGFAWFARVAAGEGEAFQAGTHVLLQIVTLWAFVLDAFAFTAEYEVGKAFGAQSRPALRRAVRLTGELSLACGVGFCLITWLGGPWVLGLIVADPTALAAAREYMVFCALIPLIGVPVWLLDGVFIGAVQGPTLRNAMAIALAGYVATDLVLRLVIAPPGWTPYAAWLAFLTLYVWRAAPLALAYPGLERKVGMPQGAGAD